MAEKIFKYVAKSDGTLAHPYRHVKAGDEIESDREIKADWLAPVGTYNPNTDPLPLTGNKAEEAHYGKPAASKLPVTAPRAGYDANMKHIVEAEKNQDAKKTGGEAGTGSKEVL